jgi:predicted phage replisome organizer
VSEVKWIKLSVNIFSDEKIQLIEALPEGDSILMIWIKILALAGRCNERGRLLVAEGIPYNEEMLATVFNRNLNTVRLALDALSRFGMIELHEEEVLWVRNWEKYQNVEGLDKIREQNRVRQRRHRQKKLEAPRHHHGDKVLLTDDEYQKLCERYTKSLVEHYIEKINDYCVSHGKNYDDYNRTIHNWIKRDRQQRKISNPVPVQEICPECGASILAGVCHKCGWRKNAQSE